MTKNQEKALAALAVNPTMKAAADAIGIDPRTIRRYLKDPDFLAEYRRIQTDILADARRQAQQLMNPALNTLAEICSNHEARNGERVAAARSILEWAARLTEITDIMERLEALENADHIRN